MADSDDEYDRRRSRDKFAKERSGGLGRRDYNAMDRGYQRTDYQRRDMGRSSSSAIPAKRPRRDWGEDTYDPQPRNRESESGEPSPPLLMSFKQFLATQDDSITDEDAISKYQDYKLDFKRQQLHSFFIQHKDEEWFKLKYHPEDSVKAKEDATARVQRRQEVFNELMEMGVVDKALLDYTNEPAIVRLLDGLVVKLEGGTEEDVRSLEPVQVNEPEEPEPEPEPEPEEVVIKEEEAVVKEEEEEAAVKEENGDGENPDTPASNKSGEDKKDGTENGEDGALTDSDNEKEKTEPALPVKKKPVVPPKKAPKMVVNETMQLHKTASIFLRNIAPTITKAEIEELCQRYTGFLRVGLAEPLPERKYYRRGWASFKRDVNIKDIAWNMGTVRVRDCDLGPIVNRDLTRRVRTVNGLTAHRNVAQNDLRLAAKIVQIFDKKWGLYQPEAPENPENQGEGTINRTMESLNPLLQNITDYLIEEASAEEEELLGGAENSETPESTPFERDSNLILVLDRIILYLRLVHSIDFYNAGEYPHEDEMPNRCGLVHVRGPAPNDSRVPPNFCTDFCKTFENKVQVLMSVQEQLTDDEVVKLGKKDPEKEVEAFITANTQELAKDKWLCPLSGKKFKGPEFIRKHITNKHGEKLDEVRIEVTYFNNYLMDGKRPGQVDPVKAATAAQQSNPANQPPPPPMAQGNYERTGQQQLHDIRSAPPPPSLMGQEFRGPPGFEYRGGYRGRGGYGGYGPPRRDYGPPRRDLPPPPFRGPPGGYGEPGRRDPRAPIEYKDLDAPEDTY